MAVPPFQAGTIKGWSNRSLLYCCLVISELDRPDGGDEFDVKHLLDKDPHDVFNEWFDQAAKILKRPMEANIMTLATATR